MLEERQPEKSLCNEKEVERKVAGLNPMDEEVFSGPFLATKSRDNDDDDEFHVTTQFWLSPIIVKIVAEFL